MTTIWALRIRSFGARFFVRLFVPYSDWVYLEFHTIYECNPNLGGLFRGSFWREKRTGVKGGGGGKITPFLNLVRIMLETSNLARKYTDICSLRKYTFQYFFFKKSPFFGQNSTFTQSNSVRAGLQIS